MSLNDFRHCNVSSFHITRTADYSRLEDANVAREWRSASITVGHPFIDRVILSLSQPDKVPRPLHRGRPSRMLGEVIHH